MKWMVFLFILPVAMASILPASCNSAPVDYGECSNILSDTSLSQAEKEDLYLNLLNNQTDQPNHDFIWNWNNQIAFTAPPANVLANSNGTLQNAWLKIVGVNKSVFDINENKWFAQPNGRIQIADHFDIQIPTGTQPGDCQTTYAHNITQNDLTVKANGQTIGTTVTANYNLDLPNRSDLSFQATWALTGQLTTNHYKTIQHRFYDGWEWHYWYTCDFVNTTTTSNHLNLADNLPTIVFVPNYAVQTAYDAPAQKLWLKTQTNEPLNEIQLTQGPKSFTHSRYRYDLNQALAPYGALYATRTPENETKTNFILLDKNETNTAIATSSTDNCQIHVLTDFDQTTQECNPTNLTQTRIELTTDKNFFDRNETIHLQARLLNDENQPIPNQPLQITTKNTIQLAQTDSEGQSTTEIPAEQTDGVINAFFQGQESFAGTTAATRITTGTAQNWITLGQLFGVFSAYYFLYLIIKRKAGAV